MVGVLLVLVAGLAADIVARVQLADTRAALRRAQAGLQATRTRLTGVLAELASTRAALVRTTDRSGVLQTALTHTAAELNAANANLTSARTGDFLQGLSVVALNSCLAGVEQALNAASTGNTNGAVAAISSVADSCQALEGASGDAGGPVYPFDFPDPDVIRVGSTYYGYATNSAGGNIQIVSSPDLTHWSPLGNALPQLPGWADAGASWAPGVIGLAGRYVLYYSVVEESSGDHCISVAVAATPQGPFTDSSKSPLVCQRNLGGSIDPSPFVAPDGTAYLVWKSQGTGSQPPTIWSQPLNPSGTSLAAAPPRALLQPGPAWEGGVVEGPAMLVSGGEYLLFYSANDWNSASYAIGVAECQGPSGPCTRRSGPLLASQSAFAGPGGPSLFTDPSGGLWMAFHAWRPRAVGYPNSRLLFIRRLSLSSGWPVVGSAP